MPRRAIACLCLVFVFFVLGLGLEVAAQTVRTGSITGTVKDESGATLPGVTVTVTSPALQVPQIVQVTGPTGDYLISELPAGAYQIVFELTGFSKFTRQDLLLTTGFVAKVDVALKIGALEETVTVSGQSPLVDVETTRGGGTVSDAELLAIPTNRNYQDIMNLTPGLVTAVPPQPGVIGMMGEANGFKNYGATFDTNGGAQERTSIEGIDMHSNENPDFSTVQEVDVKTYGNSAEVSTPGAAIQMIVKSGGNSFSGRYQNQYMTDTFQSTNVDAALKAQGIAAGETAVYYEDLSGDLGGRIVRDKLWFYGALREKDSKRTLPGYLTTAGGVANAGAGTPSGTPANPVVLENDEMAKLSWQPSSNNKFVAFYSRNKWDEKQYIGSAVTTARFDPEDTTPYLRYYNYQDKGEWDRTLSSRLFASVMVGDAWYVADYTDDCNVSGRPACVSPLPPATVDLATQVQTGTPFVNGLFHRPRNRVQSNGSLSYSPERFLGGSHEFKVGYMAWWQRLELLIPDRGAAGNYQLVYDKGVPDEFVTTNFPVDGKDALDTYAGFIQDTWRATQRLTVNLGLRMEQSHAWVPPQTKVQGTFGTSAAYPEINGGSWFVPAPRFGFAFDLSGNGKTVLKGTAGRYNFDMGDGFANNYNPNTQTNTTYLWHAPAGATNYVPGEVNLNLNGPDFISVTGGSTYLPNLALKDPHVNEVTGSLEHEFPGSISLRGLWVFKETENDFNTVNVGIPYGAYAIPVVREIPGPNGLYGAGYDGSGQDVTLYDFTANYKGGSHVLNEFLNRPSSQNDHYNSFEATLNKRAGGGRYFFSTAFLATKSHAFINGIPQSPDAALFNINNTWDWTYRLSASYRAPWDVNISSLNTIQAGIPSQNTYTFREVDPNGGACLCNIGNQTVPVEPFGAERGPLRSNWNLRASKTLTIRQTRKLSIDVDVLNVLNSNPSWNTSYLFGPTYNYVTSIQPPRIARLGVTFMF